MITKQKPNSKTKNIAVSLSSSIATFLNPKQTSKLSNQNKMSDREDSDSDAPDEFTSEQAIKQDEVIRKLQKDNKARVVREGKERRKRWAERKTPRPSKGDEDVMETETEKESTGTPGMLPDEIVQLLAAREKKVFQSDSEDEKVEAKRPPRKKKPKSSGMETVILKDMSPPQCLQNSLEFLKKKKMLVPRSSSVLINSNQALRFISTSGLLNKK